MWEDILTKDTVLDLISKFIFIERKEYHDELTNNKNHKETIIFPRYHNLTLSESLLLLFQSTVQALII